MGKAAYKESTSCREDDGVEDYEAGEGGGARPAPPPSQRTRSRQSMSAVYWFLYYHYTTTTATATTSTTATTTEAAATTTTTSPPLFHIAPTPPRYVYVQYWPLKTAFNPQPRGRPCAAPERRILHTHTWRLPHLPLLFDIHYWWTIVHRI